MHCLSDGNEQLCDKKQTCRYILIFFKLKYYSFKTMKKIENFITIITDVLYFVVVNNSVKDEQTNEFLIGSRCINFNCNRIFIF